MCCVDKQWEFTWLISSTWLNSLKIIGRCTISIRIRRCLINWLIYLTGFSIFSCPTCNINEINWLLITFNLRTSSNISLILYEINAFHGFLLEQLSLTDCDTTRCSGLSTCNYNVHDISYMFFQLKIGFYMKILCEHFVSFENIVLFNWKGGGGYLFFKLFVIISILDEPLPLIDIATKKQKHKN
jgi:hypothetical protein